MSNRHLQFRFVLGTIVEWGVVAYLAYKLLYLIGTVLEWLCDNIIGTITAVGIGIMLVAVVMIVFLIFDGSRGEDNERIQKANQEVEQGITPNKERMRAARALR